MKILYTALKKQTKCAFIYMEKVVFHGWSEAINRGCLYSLNDFANTTITFQEAVQILILHGKDEECVAELLNKIGTAFVFSEEFKNAIRSFKESAQIYSLQKEKCKKLRICLLANRRRVF